MIASEAVAEAVAERWLERVLLSYPGAARASLLDRTDPFRNPAGHVLKENLLLLARELLGEMRHEALEAPLDAIVRLRAVQGFSVSDAIGFVFELRDAACEFDESRSAVLNHRIDQLALMAFDRYITCRELIFELRMKELRSRAQFAARAAE